MSPCLSNRNMDEDGPQAGCPGQQKRRDHVTLQQHFATIQQGFTKFPSKLTIVLHAMHISASLPKSFFHFCNGPMQIFGASKRVIFTENVRRKHRTWTHCLVPSNLAAGTLRYWTKQTQWNSIQPQPGFQPKACTHECFAKTSYAKEVRWLQIGFCSILQVGGGPNANPWGPPTGAAHIHLLCPWQKDLSDGQGEYGSKMAEKIDYSLRTLLKWNQWENILTHQKRNRALRKTAKEVPEVPRLTVVQISLGEKSKVRSSKHLAFFHAFPGELHCLSASAGNRLIYIYTFFLASSMLKLAIDLQGFRIEDLGI